MKPACRFVLVVFIVVLAGCGHKGIYSQGYYSGRSAWWPNETHVVQAGETLYSIAWQYGQDYREVAKWNGIASPYTIYPKQRLSVVKPAAPKRRRSAHLTKVNKPSHPAPAKQKSINLPVNSDRKLRRISQKLIWQWPAKGRVVSRFSNNDPGLKGIDITNHSGAPIYAAQGGVVVYSGSGLRGYGKLIIIKHNEIFLSAYAHNRRLRVKEGEKVKKGEHIADMGNTGTDMVKLHFEIRRNGIPVNPFKYLPKQ